jgi:hypothetical protein
MPAELQVEIWRVLVSTGMLVLMALGSYIVSVLHRMKSDQDARAVLNLRRDEQRNEMQENVRRIANGLSIHSAEPLTKPEDVPGAVDERAINAASDVSSPKRDRAQQSIASDQLHSSDDSNGAIS